MFQVAQTSSEYLFMTRLPIWAALLLSLLCVASQAQERQGHLRPEIVDGRAQMIGHLPPSRRLQLSLVLPLRNSAELHSLLRRIYDPASPDYRRFLSPEQFAQRFSPTSDDLGAVIDFARNHGFEVGAASSNRLVVPINGTVAQIENAFHVRMNSYRTLDSHSVSFSPDREPSFDAALPCIHVSGLNNFSRPQPLVRHTIQPYIARADIATGSGPGGSYLASDMRAAYYGQSALTGAGQTIALAEFDGYRRSDVDLTLSSVGQSSSVAIQNVLLDGANGAPVRADDAEPVLDIVQAIGMAPGLSAIRVYIGSSDVDVLNAIAAENLAQQVGISWTWSPDDPAVDDEFFLEMAAQGQSVFAASGDHGAFDPVMQNFYPAEDAWVTAVGGTHLITSGDNGAWAGESAWPYSGGGISPDGIPIPPWQAGLATPANGASATARNVPDVAMEADFDNYLCVMDTCSSGWAGTSFAAARWAAFAALANEQAVRLGVPPIGFLNPALYNLAVTPTAQSPLHDIISGNNNAESGCCLQASFIAVAGYDLVTGWGTPAGRMLIDALTSPSPASARITLAPVAIFLSPNKSASVDLRLTSPNALHLSVSGLPAGVTASFSDNPATTVSRLILSADTAIVRGDFLLSVTGTSGEYSATAPLALHLDAPGFILAPSHPSLALYPGASTSDTILITAYGGFTAPVQFAVTSGLPAGVTASWLNQPSTGSAELTLSADAAAAPLHTMLTITGMSGSITASTTVAIAVNPPEFLLDLSPYPIALGQGESAKASISIIPVGSFSGSVDLSAPYLPQGVSAIFAPSTTETSADLTLSAVPTAPRGKWFAEIVGSTSGRSTAAQFPQTITQAGLSHFLLAPSPAFVRLQRGSSVAFSIAVASANGFSSPVSLTAANLPAGLTAAWSANPATTVSTLTLTAADDAPAITTAPILIEGTSGDLASEAVAYVTVDPNPGFALVPSPASLLLPVGGSVSAMFSAVPQAGFSQPVTVSLISSLPRGISASLSSQAASADLRLSASEAVVPGTFLLVAAATAGAQTSTATISIRIGPPAAMQPQITSLSPAFGRSGAPGFSLTVNGSGFTTTSLVFWDEVVRPTRYISSTQLSAQIDSSDLGQPGAAILAIRQPDSGGALSSTFQFEIDSAPSAAGSPIFSIASAIVAAGQTAIYPVTFAAGASPISLTCLNLPPGVSCSWSADFSTVRLVTTTASPTGTFPVTVVFTEEQNGSMAASILLPLLLLPFVFFPKSEERPGLRIFHVLCLAIILTGLAAACGMITPSSSTAPPPSPASTFTSSGVVNLTIQ